MAVNVLGSVIGVLELCLKEKHYYHLTMTDKQNQVIKISALSLLTEYMQPSFSNGNINIV